MRLVKRIMKHFLGSLSFLHQILYTTVALYEKKLRSINNFNRKGKIAQPNLEFDPQKRKDDSIEYLNLQPREQQS